MEVVQHIPKDLINFLVVTVFSLIIGLEQRVHHDEKKLEFLFGTDRTFTLIGILGFILYIIAPVTMVPFLVGGTILSLLLGVYYFFRIRNSQQFGLTSVIVALITYSLTPLIYLQPPWMALLIGVTVVVLIDIKEELFKFSTKFSNDEFLTLSKFVVIAGIILPLLSNKPISKTIPISPYQIWLSIVAVSSISYFSYLLKKFVFPASGTIITALLGGIYSSTVTTIILARKSQEESAKGKIPPGIIAATAMMYLRILLLAFLFNKEVALKLLVPFLILIIIGGIVVLTQIKLTPYPDVTQYEVNEGRNPLEFKTALIFGLLFAFFSLLTHFVINRYGHAGVNVLSFIVGVTDIDPYILNLFQDTGMKIPIGLVAHTTLIATISNNIIKMIYALILGAKKIRKNVIIGFSIYILVSILLLLFI
ncbi:MAG TPA: MgtC/SapB family protein [Bacteroidetes bacterium]|nr:MgtC/SapB family protein [Bacteroidota bacterium]